MTMRWNLRRGCVAPRRFCDERGRFVTSGRQGGASGLAASGHRGQDAVVRCMPAVGRAGKAMYRDGSRSGRPSKPDGMGVQTDVPLQTGGRRAEVGVGLAGFIDADCDAAQYELFGWPDRRPESAKRS